MSECRVCIGGGEVDCYWEFQSNKIILARKDHRCCECGREIAKGDKYEYFSGKIDGGFDAYHTCLDCSNIRQGLSCDGEAWPAFGLLWDDVIQNFPHLRSTACLLKIKTPSAKTYFLERWRKWKGLPE